MYLISYHLKKGLFEKKKNVLEDNIKKKRVNYFLPKSAGISPQTAVSHFNMGLE